MRGLIRLAAAVAVAMATVSTLAAPAHAGQGPGGGSCAYEQVGPGVWQWVCDYGSGSPGSPGGGSNQKVTCVVIVLTPAQVQQYQLPPPPKGEEWAVSNCDSTLVPGGLMYVDAKTGVPSVTPSQLEEMAVQDLIIGAMKPSTAPPRGGGLVGLPEWFWVSARQWHSHSFTLQVGPVWAKVIASPSELVYVPGDGQGDRICPGPGTSYDRQRPAWDQRTKCAFTYDISSAGQPGGAFLASVQVTWDISWTGSGGAGGTVASGLPVPYYLDVRVAQAEALVSGSGR